MAVSNGGVCTLCRNCIPGTDRDAESLLDDGCRRSIRATLCDRRSRRGSGDFAFTEAELRGRVGYIIHATSREVRVCMVRVALDTDEGFVKQKDLGERGPYLTDSKRLGGWPRSRL